MHDAPNGGSPVQPPSDDKPPVLLIDGQPVAPTTPPEVPDHANGTTRAVLDLDQTQRIPIAFDDSNAGGPEVLDQELSDEPEPEDAAPRRRTAEEILAERLVPADSDRSSGRLLRVVAGVDEEVLDWVPEERARYSRLGAIVLNTGLLAGVSLMVALGHIVEANVLVLIGVACFWAFLVVSIDGWLIASTHGSTGSFRMLKFVPRLIISLLLGFVIAEPLVLWVFNPAITKEVQDLRAEEVDHAVEMWTHCNPTDGLPTTIRECANGDDGKSWIITIPGEDTPQAQQQAMKTLTTQRDQAKASLTADLKEWNRLNNLARRECNGVSGPGFSGELGVGPNCKRNRAEADTFRKDKRLNLQQKKIDNLDAQITRITRTIRSTSDAYGRQVRTAIDARRAEKIAEQKAQDVGLLEESHALGSLAGSSPFVFAAQWLVRALLVALDCMPVLAKLIGGTTTYDNLVATRRRMRESMHDKDQEATNLHYQHQLQVLEDQRHAELQMLSAQRRAQERLEIDSLVQSFRERRAGGANGA